MKTLRSPLSVLIFLAFAGTGFLLGRLSSAGLGRGVLTAPIQPAARLAASPPPAAGLTIQQRRILMVGVDSLEGPAPRLLSVWMGFFLLDAPRFTLAPVYPLAPADETRLAFQQELAAAFGLAPEGGFAPAFTALLQNHQITWDVYLLADETTAGELIRYLQASPGAAASSGLPDPAALPRPWDDPAAASQAQAGLMQDLCWLAGKAPAEADFLPLLGLIPAHLRTDLDPAQAVADWLRLRQAGPLLCEFPTLSDSPVR